MGDVISLTFRSGVKDPESCDDKVKGWLQDMRTVHAHLLKTYGHDPLSALTVNAPLWMARELHKAGVEAEYCDPRTGHPWTPSERIS